jgi:hypothetical protein
MRTATPVTEIIPAAPARQAEIARFLSGIFGPDVPAGFWDPHFLAWKFFDPHPAWEGARSYIVEQEGAIVAHACVWPIPFRSDNTRLACTHLIDWAATPAAPGAGIAVYRKLMQMSGAVLAIGGSDQARRVLPKIGFKPLGSVSRYARVIRPWRRYRTRPRGSFAREVVRLGRNTLWSLAPKSAAPREWSCRPIPRAGAELDVLLKKPVPDSFTSGDRSAAALNYLLDCPLAPSRLFVIEHSTAVRGYFLLNTIAGQCRIIDLFVDSASPADWQAACRLAVRQAAAEPETCELVTFSSLPWISSILESEGFHKRDERPTMLFDPAGTFSAAPQLHLQMADSDACFLSSPSFPYLT